MWQAFARQLSDSIHQPIKVVFAPSEQQVGLILSKGTADLGYVTQMPFDKLRQQRPVDAWLEPIAIATEADGSSCYHAIFLTQPGKKVGIQNLKGEKIGFIEQSVSGRYLPQAFLQQQGLYNAAHVVMYQTPYAALLALAQHQVLGVFMADTVWQAPAYQALFAGKFQQSFMLMPALPSPLLVVNAHTVTPKIIKAIKQVLPTLSIRDGVLHGFQVCDTGSCPTLRTLLLKKITVQE